MEGQPCKPICQSSFFPASLLPSLTSTLYALLHLSSLASNTSNSFSASSCIDLSMPSLFFYFLQFPFAEYSSNSECFSFSSSSSSPYSTPSPFCHVISPSSYSSPASFFFQSACSSSFSPYSTFSPSIRNVISPSSYSSPTLYFSNPETHILHLYYHHQN